MYFGGEGPMFWAALILTALVKWLLSEKTTRRRLTGGVVSGMIIGYFGHDFVIRSFDILTPDDDVIVGMVLVLTGEHMTRFLLTLNADRLLDLWKGKK